MKLNHLLAIALGGTFAAITTVAYAKLPAPPALTEEQKAKAAEAKEKAAETAKKEAADLGRYQDRAAARFFADAKAAGKAVPAPTWVPPVPAAVAAVQPSSSESHGQKQATAPKTQSAGTPAAAKKAGTGAKPTPAKG